MSKRWWVLAATLAAAVGLAAPASAAPHMSIGVYDEVGFKLGQYWSVLWSEKPGPA